MPRPRTVSDDAVLDAAISIVEREGPSAVTFARVARDVGLSPATLVQRFGNKRGLLLAAASRGWNSLLGTFTQTRCSHTSPLAALSAALMALASGVRTREALVNSIAFLHLDLSDPEFHRHAVTGAQQMRERIKKLLDEALAAGELAAGTDTAALAAAVQVTYNGALITWAIETQGAIEEWLRAQIDLLLKGFRAPPAEALTGKRSDRG